MDYKAAAETAPGGRPRLSRSEAARHASLVRWKKESAFAPQTGGMANPKIAARVKEILAEKANKGKKKKKAAGGKGKAKPKDTRTPQEKRNQNRAAIAKQSGMGDLEGPLVRIAAGMSSDLEPDAYDKLEKQGLIKRHADGTATLTPAGKKWKAAADKGDLDAAQGALADGKAAAADAAAKDKDKAEKQHAREQAKAERAAAAAQRKAERDKAKAERQRAKADRLRQRKKAHKAMEDTLEIKAGARHSASDQQHIQAIHDSAVACGAMCAADDAEEEDAADAAVKAMQDDPASYAMHECGDIMQAASALGNLCMLIQSELAEADEDDADVSQLVGAARTLVQFVGGELDELEGASGGAADYAGRAGVPIKAIARREDVNPKEGVAEYGDVRFADEKNKKYPVDTPDHVRAAWSYINKPDNAAKYDDAEVKQIKARIIAAWKQQIDEAGPPSAATKDADYMIDGDAIKALDADRVGAFAVRFGSADEPDMSQMRDYFTKSTDFWIDAWDRRPMLYHHALDEDTQDAPRIGTWVKAEIKDEGVWLEGQLDRHHRYYSAIKELIRRGALRLSSDSAPHLVRRALKAGGVHEVTRWPLLAASLTPTPAEPRLTPVSLKSLIEELEAIEDPDVDTTKSVDTDRVRRLMIELDLLTLETTTDAIAS